MFLANSVSGGGAELAARIVASRLNSSDFSCSFVAINDWPDDDATFSNQVFRLGRKYKGSFGNLVKSLLEFNRLVETQKPDFLIINCELPELFSVFVRAKCQRIVVEHTTKPWGRLRILGLIVRRYLVRSNAIWVSVTSSNEIWGANNISPIHIPNPIVHDLSKMPTGESDIKRLFFVGRLNSIKQPDFILQASKESGLPGILIGDGPERERIQNQITLENLDIELAGHSMNPWDHFRGGDLVIVPSKYEGDGLVVAEAIIIGAPLLLLDNLDLRRFQLNRENYFNDFSELLHKIEKHKFNSSKLIPREKARQLQVELRSPEFVARKWKDLLIAVAKGP